MGLAVCEPRFTPKAQIQSDKFQERDAATEVMIQSFMWCCPATHLGKWQISDFQSQPLPSKWCALSPGASSAPGGRDAPPCHCRAHKLKVDTRYTFIYFHDLMLKPEVDTHPRNGLNSLPAAKSFLFLAGLPNPHLLQAGKQHRQRCAPWGGKV